MNALKIFSVFSAAFSIAVLAALVFGAEPTTVDDSAQKGVLGKDIPARIGALTSVEKPLGNTEEVMRASEKILMVSDYLNREYTLADGRKFSLYISYWVKNKMRITDAASHTPDRCWVKNGWENVAEAAKINASLEAGGRRLMPAYERVYRIGNNISVEKRNVLYWFVVNGSHYDFGKEKSSHIPNPFVWLKGAIFVGAPEMYFIRIDSASDLPGVLKDPDAQKLLDYLGKLAIYEK